MRKDFKIFNRLKENREIAEEELSKEEKEKIKSRVLKKIKNEEEKEKNKNKKRLMIGTVACALFMTLAFTNEDVIAKVSNIGRNIESFFEKEDESLKPYKNKVLLEKEDQGIKFIIHEAMYNDAEILISASVDQNGVDKSLIKENRKYEIIPEETKFEIYNQGEKIEYMSAGGQYEYNRDGTNDFLLSIGKWDKELTGNIEVKIKVNAMIIQYHYKEHERITGDWDLTFNINADELNKDIKIIEMNKELNLKHKKEEENLIIQDLRITPLAMYFNVKNKNIAGFEFYDEKGKELDFVSQGGSDNDFSYRWIIDREIEKIKVVPTFINQRDGFKAKKKFKDLAFEINID